MQRGKLVIVAMVVVAIGMGGFAWWVHQQRGRQCLEFWGVDIANLIRHAPDVELLVLEPLSDDAAAGPSEPTGGQAADGASSDDRPTGATDTLPPLEVEGRQFAVVEQRSISQVPGLVHARHSLLMDYNFQWEVTPRQLDCTPQWTFALRFRNRSKQATVAFAPGCRQARLLESARQATLIEPLSDAWAKRSRTWRGSQP